MKTRISQAKRFIILVLFMLSFPVYSGGDYFDIEPIKLPARDSAFLRQFISLDVTGDGKADVLELTQDEQGFALQLVKHVVGDELLLGWPLLPEWNESLSAFSVIESPEPVVALLGNGTIDAENRQALDIYHGIDLMEHLRIDLSEDGANVEPYDAMTLLTYNSIEDFTFAVSRATNIEIFDQNFDQPISTFIFTNNIIFFEGVYFTSFLDVNFSVLDENGQLSILDVSDGSTLWQGDFQISQYKVGNFDGDFNQEILAYSESLQSLYLFDASQNTPIWTISGLGISDFAISDVNLDGTNEIYVIDNSGQIINLNHNGQVVNVPYQTQNLNSFISLMHYGEALTQVILTENEIINHDLSSGLDVYSRQQKSFGKYIAADLNQNGTDELIAIGKKTLDIEANFLIEIINSEEPLESQKLTTDNLDFEFDRYDIPVEVGQFDEDENLEIVTIYYNGEEDFMTWANEVRIYDGLTFELEKSISLSAFDMWGVVFQIVTADGNNDGIDEIYAFYSPASSAPNTDFDLVRIDTETSGITWDSRSEFDVDFSGVSSSRVIAGDFDQDDFEELAIHYTLKFRLFDLDSMSFQLDLTRLFSFFSLEPKSANTTLWSMSSGSLASTARPTNIDSGEAGETVEFNLINLQYLNQMANNIYFLINAEGAKIIDKSTDTFLIQSKKINHNKLSFSNPQIVKSSVDNSIYYIGNSFGYWRIKRKVIDHIFSNGFEFIQNK